MYETRLQAAAATNTNNMSFQDENRRVQATKGLAGQNVTKTMNPAALSVSSRRALGDIGNLMGALSTRCFVSKENQENATVDQQPQATRVARPITRKFGATIANNANINSQYIKNSSSTCTDHEMDIETISQMDSQRTKQRRTVSQNSAGSSCRKTHEVCMTFSHEKNLSLTAMLTSECQAVCEGSEVEMEEAEHYMPNIDENDIGNPLAVVDYVEDIHAFYRKTEIQSCVPSDYMSRQPDINEKMRAILIDWLIEVHLKFKLMPETLYLTVNLIDRFLACESVVRKNLQLVGVTAMLVAAKYEEIWAPEVQDFVFISDKAYTREQVLDMEKQMLNKLTFNLTVPTPYVFMTRFLKAAGADTQLEMLAFFLIELCLTEYCMVKYSPSHLAAAAVYTAHQTLNKNPCWSTTVQHHTGYTEMHLRECALKMVEFHRTASEGNLTVVHKKYSSPKFSSVATLQPAVLIPL